MIMSPGLEALDIAFCALLFGGFWWLIIWCAIGDIKSRRERRKNRKEWRTYDKELAEYNRTHLVTSAAVRVRERISPRVRGIVWRRDGGQCVRCGSVEKLELGHIIPWSLGGSDTEENIQLLCQWHNRSEGNRI